jgi:hypothetical protein
MGKFQFKIMIVDDNYNHAESIQQRLDLMLGHVSELVDFQLHQTVTGALQDTMEYDVAILDYIFVDAHGEPWAKGVRAALQYAEKHRDTLVVVKTVHRLAAEDEQYLREHAPSIRIAQGTHWVDEVRNHVAVWILDRGCVQSWRRRFVITTCALPDDAAQLFVDAAGIVTQQWVGSTVNIDSHVAALQIFGSNLAERAALTCLDSRSGSAIASGRAPYIVAHIAPDKALVPWEFLLFRPTEELWTPIARTIEVKGGQPSINGRLGRVLFVYQEGISYQAELAEIRRALVWDEPEKPVAELLTPVTLAKLLNMPRPPSADILHFAMHGVERDEPVRPAAHQRFLSLVSKVKPRIVVLNVCNGFYLLHRGAGVYAMKVDPLVALLRGGVDSLVTTQFLLENERTPAVWSYAFYAALFAFGDVGLAAGWARHEVATRIARLWELATITVSRSDSRFIPQLR